MKVVTTQEMQEIDRKAIMDYGIPGLVLMENAGIQVVKEIQTKYGDLTAKKIAIFAGKGNNGGDGLVVARHLHNQGIRVAVCLLAKPKDLSKDAAINYQIAVKSGVKLIEISAGDSFPSEITEYDLLVDALLGTGITGPLKGLYKEAVSFLNSCKKPIISIDIPTGLSADSGEILGEHINADLTVTLGLPKKGLILFPANDAVGELKVVDIALPQNLIDKEKINLELLEAKKIKNNFTPRESDSHKGTYGHILILGGSSGKGGAGVMACLAALRVGTGLVTLAIPEGLNPALEKGFPEIMTLGLRQTKEGFIDLGSNKVLVKAAEGKSCLLIGPGLGTHTSTAKLLKSFLRNVTCPIILDADALNIVAGDLKVLDKLPRPIIITPHPGEMARLTGLSTEKIQGNRLGIASEFAKENNLHVVLKGAGTVIASPSGEIYINSTGNPGMATAGTGDVLGGVIAGFIGQRFPLINAIQAGVYLHGLAGDLAAEKTGELSLIATDLIKELPAAIKTVCMTCN